MPTAQPIRGVSPSPGAFVMASPKDPVQAADAEARALAQTLLAAQHAALAWSDPETGHPSISRIAFGLIIGGTWGLVANIRGRWL